jgi:hypothetical protein
MDTIPESVLALETRRLAEEESRLEEEARALETRLSGLRDIGLVLRLAGVKLSLCLRLMGPANDPSRADERAALEARITEASLGALRLVDGLLAENVSEDQRGVVQADPLYARFKSLLEEFLLAGGGGYLGARETDARARRILSRALVASIRRYAEDADRYPALELEDYPAFVRKLLLLLFPVWARERPAQPPYGIDDGEELTYTSPRMKLPLSQAVFYIENELLPDLGRRLEEDPGNGPLQEEIGRVRERLEGYRKLRFFPRSTPVLLEKGYYTEGMTGYTADGEMLVPVPLPVSYRSGTNTDRMMELVRMDVVRRVAGRGVSPELDEEYRRLRSLESGIRGSSRTASMKLDAGWGYRVLRQACPFLARLADRGRFRELVDLVGSTRSAERRVESMIESEQALDVPRLPALEGEPMDGPR